MKNFFPASLTNNSAAPSESVKTAPRQGVVQLSEPELDQVVGGFALATVGPLAPLGTTVAGPFGSPSLPGVSAFAPLGSPRSFASRLTGFGGFNGFGGLGGVMASGGGVRGGGFSGSGAGSE